jgi:hypothetical protein
VPTPTPATPADWRDDQAIRAAADAVLARDHYRLDEAFEPPDLEWLKTLLEWLLAPLRWLSDLVAELPFAMQVFVVVLLVGVLLLLVGHIVWSLATALRVPRLGSVPLTGQRELMDPNQLEELARSLADGGDYVGACRRLLQAALCWLQLARKRRFRPGLTNSEVIREYTATPVADPLRQLVATIDRKWYGDEPCFAEDYQRCAASAAAVRVAATRGADAPTA